jgi:hypothetical protein
MAVYGLWHGGASYGLGEPEEHLEVFRSEQSASDALRDRYQNSGQSYHHFEYVNRPPEDARCPAVNEDTAMLLYHAAQNANGRWTVDQPYTQFVLGPRCGIRRERL